MLKKFEGKFYKEVNKDEWLQERRDRVDTLTWEIKERQEEIEQINSEITSVE